MAWFWTTTSSRDLDGQLGNAARDERDRADRSGTEVGI
jgi:hypothetical protein